MQFTPDLSATADSAPLSSNRPKPRDASGDANARSLAEQVPTFQVGPYRWPRLMRREEVGTYLSVSGRYVDSLVDNGYIPGPKLTPSSRCTLWDRVEIDRWLDDASAQPDGPSGARSFDDIVSSGEAG